MPTARAGGSAPFEFTVRGGAIIDHDTARDVARRRTQALVWREAFVSCGSGDASLPQLAGDLPIADSKTGAHGADEVTATGRFQCGRAGLPDLIEHMRTAQQVIVGEVTAVQAVADHGPITEHATHWQLATIQVTNTFKTAGGRDGAGVFSGEHRHRVERLAALARGRVRVVGRARRTSRCAGAHGADRARRPAGRSRAADVADLEPLTLRWRH
jgi:hypothetical protein